MKKIIELDEITKMRLEIQARRKSLDLKTYIEKLLLNQSLMGMTEKEWAEHYGSDTCKYKILASTEVVIAELDLLNDTDRMQDHELEFIIENSGKRVMTRCRNGNYFIYGDDNLEFGEGCFDE